MPWTAKEFASKHNKKLTGAAASGAARQATAMVREGVPEGIAIATANKHGDKLMHSSGKPEHGYDHGEGRMKDGKVFKGHKR